MRGERTCETCGDCFISLINSYSVASQESPSGVQKSQSCPVNTTTSGKKTPSTRGLCGDMSHHMCHYMLIPTSSILLQRIQWTTEKSTGVNLDLWQQRVLAPINKCLFWIPPRSWCKTLGWNHLSSCSAVVYSQSPEEEIQNHWGTPSLSISFLVRFHIHGPENRLFYMNTPSHPAAELDYRDMRSSVWTGPQDSEMYRIFQHGIEFSLIYLASHTLTRS
jgi:hypothetical protein